MTSMPTKIVLKSTTSMSLNERFSNLPKYSPPQSQQSARVKLASSTQASQANRRLAQQMANRPSVQAALKNGITGHGDVKQRLGSPNKGSVKARLTLPPRGRGRGGIGRSPQRGARGGLRTLRGARSPGRGRGRGVGFRIRGGRVQKVGTSRGTRGAGRGVTRGFGTPRGRGQTTPTRGARFMRGYGRGMRGRGRGVGRGQPPKSKEQLDNDLDSYMSKSKAHLDAELDAYMAAMD